MHYPANPTPGPPGTPNSKTQMGHGRENFVKRKMSRWVPLYCLVDFPGSAGAQLGCSDNKKSHQTDRKVIYNNETSKYDAVVQRESLRGDETCENPVR